MTLKLLLLRLFPEESCPLAGLGVSGKSVGSGPGPSRGNSNSSVRLPVRPGTAFLSRPNSSVWLLERAPVLKQFQYCEELMWDIWEHQHGAPVHGRSIPLGCGRAVHAQSSVLLPNPVLEGEGEVVEDTNIPRREGERCGMLGIGARSRREPPRSWWWLLGPVCAELQRLQPAPFQLRSRHRTLGEVGLGASGAGNLGGSQWHQSPSCLQAEGTGAVGAHSQSQ